MFYFCTIFFVAARYAEVILKINLVNVVRKYRVIADYKDITELKPPKSAFFRLPGHLNLKFEER